MVELARPGESLGTFLATNGSGYRPPDPKPRDRFHPKQAMIATLFAQKNRTELPILEPRGFFSDGTSELFDDGSHGDGAAHDGDYANTFTDANMEGTYTFRFSISGRTPTGDHFRDTITISRWVSVNVSPPWSTFDIVNMRPGKLPRAKVVLTPKDSFGNFLGPFAPTTVSFGTSVGALVNGVVSNFDGSYTQEIDYPPGRMPIVTATVQGKALIPTVVGSGLVPWLVRLLRRFVNWLLRRLK
jgi:hypothetical protein